MTCGEPWARLVGDPTFADITFRNHGSSQCKVRNGLVGWCVVLGLGLTRAHVNAGVSDVEGQGDHTLRAAYPNAYVRSQARFKCICCKMAQR